MRTGTFCSSVALGGLNSETSVRHLTSCFFTRLPCRPHPTRPPRQSLASRQDFRGRQPYYGCSRKPYAAVDSPAFRSARAVRRDARAGAAGRSDRGDPRRPMGGCAARGRRLRRSGGHQAGHLLPAARAGRRDGGRDHRLHGAEPRLAEPGAAGAPAAGGDRRRPGPRVHAGAVRAQHADPAADDAALRRGAGECRTQRRGGGGGAPRLDRGHRRRGRLPAPLVGRGAAGRPVGALPAPGLARSRRGGAPGPAPRSAAPCRRRGAAGPAARRARTPRRLLAALSGALRRDPGIMLDRARWLRRCRPHRGRAGAVAARRRGRTARRAGR